MKFGHVSVDCWSTVSYKIWRGSVKGDGHKSPTKYENLVKIATILLFFAPYGKHNTLIQTKLSLKP